MSDDTELLAQLRTLMALERNYLAMERTSLATFRSSLALLLLAPSLYISSIALNWELNPFIYILYGILVVIGVLGLWELLRSRLQLKKIRRLKTAVVKKEKIIINSSKKISDLFTDLMNYPTEGGKKINLDK